MYPGSGGVFRSTAKQLRDLHLCLMWSWKRSASRNWNRIVLRRALVTNMYMFERYDLHAHGLWPQSYMYNVCTYDYDMSVYVSTCTWYRTPISVLIDCLCMWYSRMRICIWSPSMRTMSLPASLPCSRVGAHAPIHRPVYIYIYIYIYSFVYWFMYLAEIYIYIYIYDNDNNVYLMLWYNVWLYYTCLRLRLHCQGHRAPVKQDPCARRCKKGASSVRGVAS